MKTIQAVAVLFMIVVRLLYADTAAAKAASVAMAETLLVKQDYQAAKACVAQYLREAPDDLDALYLSLAIEQTELLDYESYLIDGDRVLKKADSVMAVLEKRLEKSSGRDSTMCLYYIANVYGGISVIKAKNGSWLSALRSAVSSVNRLKEAVRRDSTLCAARLGIGAFNFYRAKKIGWMPFVNAHGERDGLREMELATRAPFPYGFAAKNSLCWALIDEKEYGRADSIAAATLAEWPGSTIFLRIRCLVALLNGRYDQAVAFGEKLAPLARNRTPVNWSDLVLSYYVVCCGNDGLGKRKEACAAADALLGAGVPTEYLKIPHVRKNIKKIMAIKNR